MLVQQVNARTLSLKKESVDKKPIMSLAYGLTGNKTMTYKNLAGPLVFGQQWTGQPLNL